MTPVAEIGVRTLNARVSMTTKINFLIAAVLLGGLPAFAQNTAPVITQSPGGQIVSAGATVALSVTATGDSLQYQWTFNGNLIPGETGAILTISNITTESSGAYQVLVYNDAGLVQSGVANVLVAVPALPFADDFANRGVITTAIGTGGGNSDDATKDHADPKPCHGPLNGSVWLTWIAPDTG